MVTLKNKKELNTFIGRIPLHIISFIKELNDYGIEGDFDVLVNKVDQIQGFIENEFEAHSEEEQNQLRFGFWAFFITLLQNKLGGHLIIAPKSDYTPYTPLLIDYGYIYNKKGNKEWVSISFDSWLNTILMGKFIGTLDSTIKYTLNKYGNIKE